MLKAVNLRTEYKTNPIGMDEPCPRFSYELEGNAVAQSQRKILVRTENGTVVWDSGWISCSETLQIEYGGTVLRPFTRYLWNVTVKDEKGTEGPVSRDAFFETGFLNLPWSAQWISGNKNMFLRDFTLDRKPVKARLYATALGFYTASLNGKAVCEDFYTPGWTDYFARVQYQAYDVTALLTKGGNTLAFELGKGWYAGRISNAWNEGKTTYGDTPALLAELHIEFEDGSTVRYVTGKEFSMLQPAFADALEVRSSDIYDGEVQRARAGMETWKCFRQRMENECAPVTVVRKSVEVVWQSGAPVRCCCTLSPQKKQTVVPGQVLLDFGQNAAGRIHIILQNSVPGQIIYVRHGEMLNPDGSLYVENLRSAEAVFTYVCAGKEIEEIEPKFSFYGCRYAEVTGITQEDLENSKTKTNIYFRVLTSDLERVGKFSCSDLLLNSLYSNIVWGQRGNFIDIPTDCPQRDERLGWTGDTQVFANTATWNTYAPEFYTKWIADLNLSRSPDGCYPSFAPDPYSQTRRECSPAAGWSDAGLIVPWNMYVKYGDTRLLKTYLHNMGIQLDCQITRAGSYLVCNARYKDWLNINCPTDETYISTAYLAGMMKLLSRIASVCGDMAESRRRERLYEEVRKAFIEKFFSMDGELLEKTQTAALLAFHFGLVPENGIAKTKEFLVTDIRATHNTHLTTGFLGTPLLLKVLTQLGEIELAYDLLFQKTYPGWLYPVTQGATTMWERWNSWTKETGFGSIGMNSFNHYAYGAVGEWFYETICGIVPDENEPAFRHFKLAPMPAKSMQTACAEYKSIRGMILSEWRRETDGRFRWRFQIPAGTTAEIVFPDEGTIPAVDGITKDDSGKWTALPGKYEVYLGSRPAGTRKI